MGGCSGTDTATTCIDATSIAAVNIDTDIDACTRIRIRLQEALGHATLGKTTATATTTTTTNANADADADADADVDADPTPSCCLPNCRAIRPRPAEIEFTWYHAVISFTFGFLESDLFLLMARIPVFGFPCAWSAAPHHGGFRWEFASVVGPGAGGLPRPTPLSISSSSSSSTSTSITTTCMCGIYSMHGRCGM